VSNSSVI